MKSAKQPSVPFDPDWKTVLEFSAVEVLDLMAGAQVEINRESVQAPRGGQTAMVGIAGALRGMTTLRCSQKTAAKLASLMLGGDAGSNPAMARDALGELCNIIAGNFKSKIRALEDACFLSVPTVITGEDYVMEMAAPAQGATVALTFEGETIWVALTTHA
jgi:chemotaxis protein CheX